MQVQMERRAEVQLRFLDKSEQRQIARALKKLAVADAEMLSQTPGIRPLRLGISDKQFYGFRATPELELVLSVDADTCTLEDVVSKDRLDRLLVGAAA